jgi:hypothetical protein
MRSTSTEPLRGSIEAIFVALVIGTVQIGLFVGFANSTVRDPSLPDRGFGSNPNLAICGLWFLGFFIVSALAIVIALWLLRVRWCGLVAFVVLGVETWLGIWIGDNIIGGESNWRAVILLPTLTVLMIFCRLALPRWDRSADED